MIHGEKETRDNIIDEYVSKHTIRKLIKELPELSAFAKQKMKAGNE